MMGGGRGSQSKLDKLLESQDGSATIEAVLSDSEILTECKWGNQKLLNL
jgi:hypothetical protein